MGILTAETVKYRYTVYRKGTSLLAVGGVSLDIVSGEFLGIIGPNGSGKSTLLKLLSGSLMPGEGKVLFQGKPLSSLPQSQVARSIAFVPQNTYLDFPFTCREIVLMGRFPHLGWLGLEDAAGLAIVDEVMRLTRTEYLARRPITDLSGGEQQRVILAQALAQDGEVLMLDEPTSHLDIASQLEILDLLKSLNSGQGRTIVVVLHDLNLAALYCDRLLLIREGLIAAAGTPAEVITEEIIAGVYGARTLVEKNPKTALPNVVLLPAHLSRGSDRN